MVALFLGKIYLLGLNQVCILFFLLAPHLPLSNCGIDSSWLLLGLCHCSGTKQATHTEAKVNRERYQSLHVPGLVFLALKFAMFEFTSLNNSVKQCKCFYHSQNAFYYFFSRSEGSTNQEKEKFFLLQYLDYFRLLKNFSLDFLGKK